MNYIKRKFIFAHQEAASVYAKLSYCSRLKVGSVISKGDSLISYGYNGMPSGEPNVCELDDGTTNPRVRHAEVNALRKLIKSESSAENSAMFVTHAPCTMCAIDIYESGIKVVFFAEEYKNLDGVNDLLKKGVKVFRVDIQKREIIEYSPIGILVKPYSDDLISF